MPYNPSTGVYSLPAIYLAVPGTVIIAAQHNTPLVDLQTANNYERPIIAGGTGAGSIAGTVANFSLVQYTAQTLDADQKAQVRENIGSATAGAFEQKSANYPVVAGDLGKTFLFTASATASFAAAADLGANFECEIWANFGVTVTLDPNASETINGSATFILQPGNKVTVWCNGTALFAKASGDPTVGPQLQGYYTGLALTTNVTDAANDVDIAAGSAASDVSPYYLMQLASALTKRIDASWAVGTNQGGLDTGSVANATYYIWLIQRSDTLVTDALFSLSSTAPTMPTNYDRKRLIGSVVRAAGANAAPIFTLGPPLYVSPNQTITSGGPLTLAHGLGVRPTLFQLDIVCTTAENGYSINDIVPLVGFDYNSGSRGVILTADATNIYIRYGADVNVFAIPNKNTGVGTTITNGNWRLIVRAKIS